MAKKINKSKKNKLVRSSSIEKTIDEGKDYVVRADRRLRSIKRVNNTNKLQTQTTKKAKITKKKKVVRNKRPIRPAIPSLPQATVKLPTAVVHPVARTSSKAISRSEQKNLAKTSSKNNQIIIQQELQDRLGRHNANIGKLNFSLRWWDPNDLDLHVICPCNTQIYYLNKKCNKCGGELDIDMNVGINMSLQPVQHIYFNKPKPGLYKFFVKYFYGPKQHQGVKGQDKSKYALSLHEDMTQLFRYEDTVSNTQREMHYDFNR